ncbi:MAG: hypothetical protein NC248_12100 [Bacteroides sp.]|nr:hypothetical protein [Muribaculum sp.]MCM1333336.1 hypothetical protein [Bacteroides sp.]
MEKKYLMYLHGFMSGANGDKQQQLRRKLKGRYEVIAPELTADPDSSLAIINKMIVEYRPEIIVGTSLGGFMVLMCDSGDARLLIANPCLCPQEEISRWKDIPQTYFCQRLDGVQTYTLTQDVLDKYLKYEAVEAAKTKSDRIFAVCSTCDERLGDRHYKTLEPILPNNQLICSDRFGHRCAGEELKLLISLIP